MKILLVGASGTISRKLYKEFSQRHEIIKASASKLDVKVDITSSESIRKMYKQIGGRYHSWPHY